MKFTMRSGPNVGTERLSFLETHARCLLGVLMLILSCNWAMRFCFYSHRINGVWSQCLP
jgi:hypothetical protein